MEIRTWRLPGRPNDTAFNKTNEGETETRSADQITGQGNATWTKTRHAQHQEGNQSRTKDQERNSQQNSHPAWNPDSRWSR